MESHSNFMKLIYEHYGMEYDSDFEKMLIECDSNSDSFDDDSHCELSDDTYSNLSGDTDDLLDDFINELTKTQLGEKFYKQFTEYDIIQKFILEDIAKLNDEHLYNHVDPSNYIRKITCRNTHHSLKRKKTRCSGKSYKRSCKCNSSLHIKKTLNRLLQLPPNTTLTITTSHIPMLQSIRRRQRRTPHRRIWITITGTGAVT